MIDDDESIPGPMPITESVRTAAMYLAHAIERDCGTRQGVTALYWALIGVACAHAGNKADTDQMAEEAS